MPKDCACGRITLMSKIAKYLNGYILGEVSARTSRLRDFSLDKSILKITPSLVVFPRTAEDIRKIMRFSWQVAEKGHAVGVTARGYGGSTDGSSLGDGIILDISRHMKQIYELDLKSRLVRVAAGANFGELNLALGAQAMTILQAPAGERLTIGGAIAQNLPAEKYNYGSLIDAVEKLEVVLSNGESITLEPLTKRQLNAKKGLPTMEGEIYRQVDGLIDDNLELIENQIQGDASYGYSGLAKVRDGNTFNLIPLFFGSLGTLGTVVEVILRTEFIVDETDFAVISFQNRDDGRDFIDKIKKLKPNILEIYDGKVFDSAVSVGKKYQFYLDRVEDKLKTKLVLVVGVSDKSPRKRASVFRRMERESRDFEGVTIWQPSQAEQDLAEMAAIRDVREVLRARGGINKEEISPIQGVYIPLERFEQFYLELQKIARKHDIPAPIQGSALTSIFEIMAEFDFVKVSDRQKAVKFISDLAELLAKVNGEFAYGAGEGRLFGGFVRATLGDDLASLYDQVRTIFDPQAILNPGSKSAHKPSDLVKQVKNGR